MAALGAAGALAAAVVLLGTPAGARGFRFKAKLVVVVVVVVAAADVTVEVPAAAPGAFKVKPSVPGAGAAAVVAGAPRESPVPVDEVGAAAMEAKRVGPALEVAAGVGAAGWLGPAPVAAGVAAVKGDPVSAVGWVAELPTEPMLKPDVPVCEELPPVKENPPDVVAGAAGVVVEPNTKPVGAVPWLEVTVPDVALVRVLLPSPKPLGFAVAEVAAVLPKFSFGALRPREKPVPPEAGVVVPKLNAGVWAAGAWVVRENSPVEGVLAAAGEGVPKLNPPELDVEKENPVAGVVLVAVFAVPKVNPPVGAPVPPKLNPLMAPALVGSSCSGSHSQPDEICKQAAWGLSLMQG